MNPMTLLEKPFETEMLEKYIDKAIQYDRWQIEFHGRYRDLRRQWLGLSERQRQVLKQIVDGFPSKAIARKLDVSQRTIEIERSRLLASYEVESTPQLVAKMTEFQLLTKLGYQEHSLLRKHAASLRSPADDIPS